MKSRFTYLKSRHCQFNLIDMLFIQCLRLGTGLNHDKAKISIENCEKTDIPIKPCRVEVSEKLCEH